MDDLRGLTDSSGDLGWHEEVIGGSATLCFGWVLVSGGHDAAAEGTGEYFSMLMLC